MVTVSFFKPSDPLIPTPEPADKNAHYFNTLVREDLLQQIKRQAIRDGTHVFLATEGGELVAQGATTVRRVIADYGGAIRLSRSHAGHRLGRPGLVLDVGHTYEVSIDPATNVILSATEMPQQPSLQVPSRFHFNPWTLPDIGLDTANTFFSRLRRQPHIPFQYPANGCSGRAHEMCRLIEQHLDPNPKDVVAKVWNLGNCSLLTVKTENNPDCAVSWLYHVAPVVKAGKNLRVIDPSLFDKPVSVAKWRSVQKGKATGPVYTSRDAYDLDQGTLFFGEEPNVAEVELRNYRDLLASQIYSRGPLPYRCQNL
jgi:hypothetical protein